jgi:hypothetical protein
MHVVLMVRWKVVVHHVGDTVNIDAASGDIGGHENTDLPLTELIKRSKALVLRTIGMDRPGGDAGLLKAAGNPVGPMLGPGKDEHHILARILKKMKQ